MLVDLDDADPQRLRQLQRTESAKRDYVKITAILILDRDKDVDQVADTLGIDHTTLYRYAQSYPSLGLQEYLGDGYRGWWGRLDAQQLAQLQNQLRRHFFTGARLMAGRRSGWIEVGQQRPIACNSSRYRRTADADQYQCARPRRGDCPPGGNH